MMKKCAALVTIVILLTLSQTAFASSAQLYAQTPEKALPGKKFTVVIALDSDKEITGVTFSVSIPDGVLFSSSRLVQDGVLRNSGDKNISIICLSPASFKNGELVELTFTADSSCSGDYSFTITDAVACDDSYKEFSLSAQSFSVEITSEKGSAGSDTATVRGASSSSKGTKPSSKASSMASSETKSSKASKSTKSSKSSRLSSKDTSSELNAPVDTYDETSLQAHGDINNYTNHRTANAKYFIAGALGTLCFIGALALAYRAGKARRNYY